ncbi:MAG: type II toxin-antitoxin system RelE/ParE family toxin [Proteobacteria bacterium]|nr:type II toxin-antitoxin system RelE/ParE family toxin [Pseudomonadota bacterium]
MKRGYRALREAEQELDDAADWYARKRQGLDERLFETYEEAIELALSMPRAGSMIADLPVDCEVRRFKLKTFPYYAVVALIDDELILVAFAHQRRKPGYWMPRLAHVTR